MNAHRLHAASKRRREVYREKLILVTAAVLIAVFCSIFVAAKGMRFVQAQDRSEVSETTYKYYKSIELEAGDTRVRTFCSGVRTGAQGYQWT